MIATVLKATNGLDRDEWLQARRKGIGGSDAATVAGVNKWKSPLDLWLEKTGQVDDKEAGEAAYWGTMMEDMVAREFETRSGHKVRRRNAILRHPEHHFMLANVDRLIVGCKIGLECKTTSAYNKAEWEDDNIPDAYYIQCQHYMAVTGYKSWYIAVLIGGNKFRYKEIKRDDELIAKLIELEAAFWQHVVNGTMPSTDGSDACGNALLTLYPDSNGEEVLLPDTAEILIREYESANSEEKAAIERKKAAQAALELMLGVNERGRIGNRIVNWKSVKAAERFDTKLFKVDYPDLAAQYTKLGEPSRRFSIK